MIADKLKFTKDCNSTCSLDYYRLGMHSILEWIFERFFRQCCYFILLLAVLGAHLSQPVWCLLIALTGLSTYSKDSFSARFSRLIWPFSLFVCVQRQSFDCKICRTAQSLRYRRPGVPAVIGLTRIYCNQQDEFLLVDVASKDASQTANELIEQGWEIEAEIPV